MELRRHTWVNWFVSPICLVDVPSALLGPIVCWYRPWNCLPSAAVPSQSPDPPPETICWTMTVISAQSPSTFRQRLKHFCSRPRSRTLSLIPGKLFPISSGSWSDFIIWTTLKEHDWLTDWLNVVHLERVEKFNDFTNDHAEPHIQYVWSVPWPVLIDSDSRTNANIVVLKCTDPLEATGIFMRINFCSYTRKYTHTHVHALLKFCALKLFVFLNKLVNWLIKLRINVNGRNYEVLTIQLRETYAKSRKSTRTSFKVPKTRDRVPKTSLWQWLFSQS